MASDLTGNPSAARLDDSEMLAALEGIAAFRIILLHEMLGEVASEQPAYLVRQRQQHGKRFIPRSRIVSPIVNLSHLIGARVSQFLEPICEQQDDIFFAVKDRDAMANHDRVKCFRLHVLDPFASRSRTIAYRKSASRANVTEPESQTRPTGQAEMVALACSNTSPPAPAARRVQHLTQQHRRLQGLRCAQQRQ
jgi:hypothetical protein